MKRLLPLLSLLLLVVAFGCANSASLRVVDYTGPQDWPLGRPSTTGTAINDTPVIYGLPDRPYQVLQVVSIPRRGWASDEVHLDAWKAIDRAQPDALILVGTRYDEMLDVDQYLAQAQARDVNPDCMDIIKMVRGSNRDSDRRLTFLAVQWTSAPPDRYSLRR